MITEQLNYANHLSQFQFTLHVTNALTVVETVTRNCRAPDDENYDTFETYGAARQAITDRMARWNCKRLH